VSSPQGSPSITAGPGLAILQIYGSARVSQVTRLCYRPVNEELTKIIHVSVFPLTTFLETCLYASSF
jgi:hypothetical protein